MYVEPPADLRVIAHELRGVYNALVEAGFSNDEALALVSDVLARAATRGGAG